MTPLRAPFAQTRSMIAVVVLIAGLIMSTVAALFAFRAFDADESQRFNESAENMREDLQARIGFFIGSIRQLAALYAIHPDLTEEQFTAYAEATGIRSVDAGITSYGIFRRVPSTRTPRYFVHLRKIGSGFVGKLAPMGMEVTESERLKLYASAVDSGEPVFSNLVMPMIVGQTPGQLMIVAAYEGAERPKTIEERRARAIGIAFARFSETGLFDPALQTATASSTQLSVKIFDGTISSHAKTPLAATSTDAKAFSRRTEFEVNLGGRPFTIKIFSTRPLFQSGASLIAILILSLGVAASLLFFRMILQRERNSQRIHFLEEVSSVLATSLDNSVIAENLTQKLLKMCDWCVIELVDDDGSTKQHLYSATTPERRAMLEKFYVDYPPNGKDRRITVRARETKRTQFIHRATPETMRELIPNPERMRRIFEIGFESIVVVPLITGEKVFGTLALYSGDPKKLYTEADVSFIEEIGQKSALAFENANLYSASQDLNRAKDHFLAMLSHELRTPMNVILGWLEILTTEEVDKETFDQALETLNRNAKAQIQLINDLLDVSRIINGKLALHPVATDLHSVVAASLDIIRPAALAKNIDCSVNIEGRLNCTVDPERIQQVLWNLLSNAAKFTPPGGRIDVKAVGSPREIRIFVTDSGQGIDEDFLPFVFDRFRQEEVGFSRSQGGLGLGLSIVRYLVEGHGGTIAVESRGRGYGTMFTVTLPKTVSESNPMPPWAQSL